MMATDQQFKNNSYLSDLPKRWSKTALSEAYELSYITNTEYLFLKNVLQTNTNFYGPKNIEYFAESEIKQKFFSNEKLFQVPFYYQSVDHLHFLIYLTPGQQDILINSDLHDAKLRIKKYYGPQNIVRYSNGGGDGGGDGGAGDAGIGFADGIFGGDVGSGWPSDGGIYGPALVIRANSGLYSGSLTSQGRIVAEQLNTGNYRPRTDTVSSTDPYEPYLTGYFGQYWQDPTQTIFGANSAIPAITGVFPSKYANLALPISGSVIYFMDLAISRATGAASLDRKTFNTYYFINALNQAISWVTTTNEYTNSLNTASNQDLNYYGATNYTDLVTGGFSTIINSKSTITAIRNIGRLISTVPTGKFGTPNAVAQTMIDNGLGFVNDFSVDLINQSVDLDDLYNDLYTIRIEKSLAKITNTDDLILIQNVLETTVPKITSPLDYTLIDKASGRPNDSVFARMQDIGKKLYEIAPNLVFTKGDTFADMLENLRTDGTNSIGSITGNTSLLNNDIISSLQSFLPQTADNQQVSVLNVIGASSGYLLEQLTKVNDAVAALLATPYGPQIRTLLTEISRTNAGIAITDQEQSDASSNPNYFTEQFESYKTQYLNLLQTIASDTTDNISFLVQTINENYDYICQQLYFEITNYNKANFSNVTANTLVETGTITNQTLFDFVTLLPYYGADPTNIGTDALLYGMAQNNTGGNLIKAILAQAKNNQLLGLAGVKINI